MGNKTESVTSSDSAAKQILMHLDSQREGPYKFVMKDGESSKLLYRLPKLTRVCLVDDTHVLVKREYLEQVKDLLQDEVGHCEHHFDRTS